MSRTMKATLLICAAGVGVLIILLAALWFSIFGWGAVALMFDKDYNDPDLEYVSLQRMTANRQNVVAVMIYDSAHTDRSPSGWFVLRDLEDPAVLALEYGANNPTGSVLFGALIYRPKSCVMEGDTGKAVVIEMLNNQNRPFIGRSFCRRQKMDLRALLEVAEPAEYIHRDFDDPHDAAAFLKSVETAPNQLLWRTNTHLGDPVVTRRIELPLLWTDSLQRPNWTDGLGNPQNSDAPPILPQNSGGEARISVQTTDLHVRLTDENGGFLDLAPVLKTETGAVKPAADFDLMQVSLILSCPFDSPSLCATVTEQDLEPWIAHWRDPGTLAKALEGSTPMPEGTEVSTTLEALQNTDVTIHPLAKPQLFVTYIQVSPASE